MSRSSKTLSVRISDAQIKTYMDDDSVTQLRDKRFANLRFRFGAHGRGSWYLVLHRHAKTVWKKIGNYPALKSGAVLARFPALLAEHSLNSDSDLVIDEFERVADLLNWYGERVMNTRNLSRHRKASVKSVLKVHLQPRLGYVQIADCDHVLIERLLFHPLQADYKLSTVRLILAVLKKAFKQARTLNFVAFNPVADVKFSDFTDAKIEPKGCALQVSRLSGVFEQLKRWGEIERCFVLMMLLHGTRIGETRLAKWQHVDLVNKTWFIPRENTKTKQELVLPLSDVAVQFLSSLGAKGHVGFLFSVNPWRGLSESNANSIVQFVSGREWRAHDLRKFARTQWMDLGVDYLVGELLLNHALSNMDKTYIHTHANELMRKALVMYHDWLLSQGLDKLLLESVELEREF